LVADISLARAIARFFTGVFLSGEFKMRLIDYEPTADNFLEEVLEGLRKPQKTLPSKFIYDERGSEIFSRICELDEYYPTRTEIAIMRESADEMAGVIGPECAIVEYGIGSALKTRILLETLDDPVACVPVDISREFLLNSSEGLAREFPRIEFVTVCANFMAPFNLPVFSRPARRAVAYFPGSTIGNLTPDEAGDLLGNMAETCGGGGGLLVGIDLIKEVKTLEAAYNDRLGVTAEFNKNLLARMNRELGADFDLEDFYFQALYNPDFRCVESYLVSRVAQSTQFGGETFTFKEGETIHTENSHKFDIGDFSDFAAGHGFHTKKVWADTEEMFAVVFLEIA
jgi:dimethylhistidine N-methyltransferase